MRALRAGLAALSVALAPALADAQAAPVRPVEFEAGGVRVIFKPIVANDVVAVRLYLRGGSAAQTREKAGIEQVIAGLGARGTEKYSKDEFTARATETGTAIGGSSAYDYSVFTAQAVRQNWDVAWDLFTQAVLRATFPEPELVQVKARMVNGLRQQRDDPDALLSLLSDSVAYAGSPFSVPPRGTPESIAALTRADLIRWRSERMTRANLLLVVVGNVSRADLARKVEEAFAGLPEGSPAARPPAAPPGGRAEALVITRSLPTNYIQAVVRLPDPASADFPATRLAMYLLHDRLFEEVRTKRNLSYAPAAFMTSRSSNLGFLYVTAAEPDTTLKVMLTEVRRLQREPVTRKDLQENVNVFTTAYWTSQETNMGQADQLGAYELLGGGWENAASFVDRLRRVSPQDVQRVAQKYLRDARFVVVGDPAKIDRTLFSSW